MTSKCIIDRMDNGRVLIYDAQAVWDTIVQLRTVVASQAAAHERQKISLQRLFAELDSLTAERDAQAAEIAQLRARTFGEKFDELMSAVPQEYPHPPVGDDDA